MPAAARVGDHHTCPKSEPGPVPHVGGAILPSGCPSVLIHDMPAARVGDRSMCNGPPDTIVMGEASVLIANKPAARVGDPTSHGGVIVAGCGCVQIGQLAQAIVMRDAAKSGTPFCEECARKKAEADARKAARAKKAGTKPAKAVASSKHRGTRGSPKPVPRRGSNATGRAIDVDAAVSYLTANAEPGSIGWCSRYVGSAIVAGGGNYTLANAKDTGPNLLRAGFHEVASGDDFKRGTYAPEPGDVVVFGAVPPKHKNGHTAMWSGTQWISDFPQGASPYAAETYKTHGSFHFYRP